MKKIILLLLTGILITACGDSGVTKEQQENDVKEEPVFTDEDIALAKEIIEFVHEKESEFVQEANKELDNTRDSYEQFQTMTEGFTADKEIREDFQSLSNDMILVPLLDEYSQYIVEGEKWELQSRVNVKNYEDNNKAGGRSPLDKFQIVMSYEDLQLQEPIIEYYDQYDVHELIIPVNKGTKIFRADKTPESALSNRFTFYKTENGNLIIGRLSPLQYNAMVLDFDRDIEKVQDDLKQLPPLQ